MGLLSGSSTIKEKIKKMFKVQKRQGGSMLDYGAINSKRIIRAEYKSVEENKAAVERIGGVKKRK